MAHIHHYQVNLIAFVSYNNHIQLNTQGKKKRPLKEVAYSEMLQRKFAWLIEALDISPRYIPEQDKKYVSPSKVDQPSLQPFASHPMSHIAYPFLDHVLYCVLVLYAIATEATSNNMSKLCKFVNMAG